MGEVMEFLQVEEEFNWFLDIIRRENCRSYLEIGSKFGEGLKRVGEILPVPSKLVSVDLPGGTKLWNKSYPKLRDTVVAMRGKGHEAQLILGDSTDPKIIEQVRFYGPYDVIFIDANHTLPYVTKDFENYGPMGKIVGFHDIAWRRAPEWVGTRIDVPQFWESVKGKYRSDEIKVCPTGKNNGIGVLWR